MGGEGGVAEAQPVGRVESGWVLWPLEQPRHQPWQEEEEEEEEEPGSLERVEKSRKTKQNKEQTKRTQMRNRWLQQVQYGNMWTDEQRSTRKMGRKGQRRETGRCSVGGGHGGHQMSREGLAEDSAGKQEPQGSWVLDGGLMGQALVPLWGN